MTTRYASADAARDNVLAIFRSQLGYTEGPNNWTKYGEWYGLQNQPYCDICVSWVFDKAGLLGRPWMAKSAWVPGTIATFESWGQAHSSPLEGDVICLEENGRAGGHVGIVESVLNSREVIYISGNTVDPRGPGSRPAGNEQEGWGVFRNTHVIKPLDVFCRPDWQAAVAAVIPAPLKPKTAPVLAPTPSEEAPSMLLITVGDVVFTWNGGGGKDSILAHSDPARIHDLASHGVRWIKPADPLHASYAGVVKAILAKQPAPAKAA